MKKMTLEIIKNFCSKNDVYRPVLNNPFLQKTNTFHREDYMVYASNSNIAIRCKSNYVDFLLENPHELNVDMNAVFDRAVVNYKSNSVFIKKITELDLDLRRLKNKDEVEEEKSDCIHCDGEGIVSWEFDHYEMDADCPYCDGEGFSYKESFKTGDKVFDSNLRVKISNGFNDVYFDPNYIFNIVKLAIFLDSDIILKSLTMPDKPILFYIGYCEVLLMPTLVMQEDEFDIFDITNYFTDLIKSI